MSSKAFIIAISSGVLYWVGFYHAVTRKVRDRDWTVSTRELIRTKVNANTGLWSTRGAQVVLAFVVAFNTEQSSLIAGIALFGLIASLAVRSMFSEMKNCAIVELELRDRNDKKEKIQQTP